MMLAVRCTRASAEGPIRPVTSATMRSGPDVYNAFLSSMVSLDGTLHAPATAKSEAMCHVLKEIQLCAIFECP